MNAVYCETSALLAWMLSEERGEDVRSTVDAADTVVTSSLTLTEAERALVRAEHLGLVSAADGQRLRGVVQRASAGWMRMMVSEDILARAARPFPVEPIRTLDAVHLASALAFTKVFPDLTILSLDARILDNARTLGLELAVRA